MTTFKIFTEPSGGYGVHAERDGELPQVILPTRATSISGERLPKVDGRERSDDPKAYAGSGKPRPSMGAETERQKHQRASARFGRSGEMNKADIKKCIKNGGFWTSKGDIPIFISRAGFEPEAYRRALRSNQVHATKREAQAAIDARQVSFDPEPPYRQLYTVNDESPAHVAWRKRQEAKNETPEQRDARLKATYEGYLKVGGAITEEQLTEEMQRWLFIKTLKAFFVANILEHRVQLIRFSDTTTIPFLSFWTYKDAAHEVFLRTWKGPLTKEAAKKLRKGDWIWCAGLGFYNLWEWNDSPEQHGWCKRGIAFLSGSEAKAAAHDLWLADRRENQMEAVTEEQSKLLHYNDILWAIKGNCVQQLCLSWPQCPSNPPDGFRNLLLSGVLFFSEKAAQAALDKSKKEKELDRAKKQFEFDQRHKAKQPEPVKLKVDIKEVPELGDGTFTIQFKTEPEHKFADVPEWCPPLLDGDVPLGFGKAFKRIDDDLHRSIHRATRGVPTWDTTAWSGTIEGKFYAAPRDSEIAILNYPWLKDEAGDKSSPPASVASHETPSGESQAKEVSKDESQNPREWTDIPQNPVKRPGNILNMDAINLQAEEAIREKVSAHKRRVADAINACLDLLKEDDNPARRYLYEIAYAEGLKVRAVE